MAGLVERDPVKNKIVAIALASAGYLLGYYVSIMNSMAGPILDGRYNLQSSERIAVLGNLNFNFSIGAMISVLLTSRLMDIFGRRRLNMLLDLSAILVISLGAIENVTILQLSRLLLGFLSSAYNMLAGITMVEILPGYLASQGNMLVYFTVTCTLLLTLLQQTFFSYQTLVDHWRVFLCYPMLVSCLRFAVLFRYMDFESPVFITLKHQDAADYRELLTANYRLIYDDESNQEMTDLYLQKTLDGSAQKYLGYAQVLNSFYRPFVFRGLLVRIGQQLSGVNFFVFFSTEIFEKVAGIGKPASLFLGIGNMAGAILGALFINRFKRIPNIQKGLLFQGASIFGMIVAVKLGITAALPLLTFFFMMSFACGIGGVANLYINKTTPPVIIGIGLAAGWLASSLVGKISPIAVVYFGSNYVMTFFGSFCLILYFTVGASCKEPASLLAKRAPTEEPLVECAGKVHSSNLTK